MGTSQTKRRRFLKKALAAGAALSTLGVRQASARSTRHRPADAVGLLYDATLCIGCKACVNACKVANGLPAEFSTPDHLWDTPLDTSATTYNVIKVYRNGTQARKDREINGYAFMKVSCNHCADPSCVSACPVGAMHKDPRTGIVAYDPNRCIGCRYCVAACPFGIPKYEYDSPTGQIGKCQLCRHRMKDGHYAACAEVCPTGATLFGRTDDLLDEAHRRLALPAGTPTIFPRGRLGGPDESYPGHISHYLQHIYGEKEYGGLQLLRLSAVDFEKEGLPKLGDTSSAAESETLQHALYQHMAMPIGVLGVMLYAAKRNVPPDVPPDEAADEAADEAQHEAPDEANDEARNAQVHGAGKENDHDA
ncbi:formate dehydrogenase, nitrate-inducible, iron-sulfur subunit [mine drainage metagenome]|jgi:Fe-S-cluster-containing dehydrogenase component|uniref:Formate dehydrogenase, nitrate-inducible, iron-sulfur subunit n=1 Tax=mine drainage metagenome TaxID=410659 RepID=A0A1J5R1P5_9ZZZZ